MKVYVLLHDEDEYAAEGIYFHSVHATFVGAAAAAQDLTGDRHFRYEIDGPVPTLEWESGYASYDPGYFLIIESEVIE